MSRESYNIFGKILILLLLFPILSPLLLTQASSKTLVFFPLILYADKSKSYLRQGVTSMLVSRLSGFGIEVISEEGFESLLGEKEKEGITSKKRAEELARGLNADYAVFGSITTIGGGYSLDLSLLELGKNGSRLTRVSKAMQEDQFILQMANLAYSMRAIIEGKEQTGQKMEERATIEGKEIPAQKMDERVRVLPKPETAKGLFSKLEQDKQEPPGIEKGLFFKPTREYRGLKPTGKISIDMTVMAFDMGDLDGGGGTELVVLGRKKLLIYQKEGASFILKDSLKPGLGEDFLKVSVGDADRNGREEIYIVSRYGIRARTSVLEWAGTFKRLDRRTGHIQVIKDPAGGKSLLLFQDSRVGEFFSGPIYFMNYGKDGKYTQGKQLPKLGGAQFYTLALFDLDKDGNPEWLGLGEESRLHVWDKEGDTLWIGDKKLGGTNNAIRLGDPTGPGELPPRISFNSRSLITDIDGDGTREIVAIKNIPLIDHVLNFKVYHKSNLIAYSIEGTSLSPAWATRDIDWCLTDIYAEGPSLFLSAQKGEVITITKGSGCIMWFE